MKKGFTLVELVIVIAIVIVLSVVSVPIYRSYVNKAILSEGYALLGTVMSAQKAYYSEYGNFLWEQNSSAGTNIWTSNETVLGIDARGNKYFTRFRVGWVSGVANLKSYFDAEAWMPEPLFDAQTAERLYLIYTITSGASYRISRG